MKGSPFRTNGCGSQIMLVWIKNPVNGCAIKFHADTLLSPQAPYIHLLIFPDNLILPLWSLFPLVVASVSWLDEIGSSRVIFNTLVSYYFHLICFLVPTVLHLCFLNVNEFWHSSGSLIHSSPLLFHYHCLLEGHIPDSLASGITNPSHTVFPGKAPSRMACLCEFPLPKFQ